MAKKPTGKSAAFTPFLAKKTADTGKGSKKASAKGSKK